jgi:sigma-B regulation protein RsbU (phosphoserine phosphatase)
MIEARAESPAHGVLRRVPGDAWHTAVSLTLLLAALAIDASTGNEISASLFYVAPVAYTAWFLGRKPAVGVALTAAVLWLLAQRLVGVTFSKPSILYWNVLAEAVIYTLLAVVVSRLQSDRRRERALVGQLAEANAQLDREARAVGKLQRELLPQQLPSLPGYEWAIHYATSTRAGGDYYDVLPLLDGRLGILIADATGHGAPAAVLMAMAKALLRAGAHTFASPDAALERLNTQLAAILPPGWFLTACFVILDPGSGTFEYSLAGHEPPVIAHAHDATSVRLAACGGPPLGPFARARFSAARSALAPGDTLVLYTDGVTETMDPAGRMFDASGLQAALDDATPRPLSGVLDGLVAALESHRGGAPMADDTTVVMLRRGA